MEQCHSHVHSGLAASYLPAADRDLPGAGSAAPAAARGAESKGTLMTADLLIVSPPVAPPLNLAAQARHLHPAALPRWRALLTERWREQLDEVSVLSRACHRAQDAAANSRQDTRQAAWRQASAAMQRAAAGWLALAEIEAALARLAAGRFGWCQRCGAAITAATLVQTPLARCCPACDGSP